MKFAILSDIHSNLEALQVVLADTKAQQCTHYVCLGDIVGYGPNPLECLEAVRALNCPTVIGNHDEYCASDIDLTGFNPMAADAIKCVWVMAARTPKRCERCQGRRLRTPWKKVTCCPLV